MVKLVWKNDYREMHRIRGQVETFTDEEQAQKFIAAGMAEILADESTVVAAPAEPAEPEEPDPAQEPDPAEAEPAAEGPTHEEVVAAPADGRVKSPKGKSK